MAGPTAVIVGAGAGEIAAATQLARQGFKVQVLERYESLGGRCSLLYKDGFRFDQGPSLVLMPELFRRAFEDLGTSMKNEGVSMLRCEPNYCIWFADRDSIKLSRDMPRLKAEIERYEGPGGFYRFCAFTAAAGYQHKMLMQSVFNQSFPTLWSMIHISLIKAVLALQPSTSFYQQAATFFRSEKMRRAWSFTSMYLGMSPYRAPGTYCMLPYAEISDGIWYPKGGFQNERIPELKPHNVFLAEEYRKSFDTIFDEQGIPEDPSFYVNVLSRVYQSAAPTGRETVMALMPVGHLPKRTITDAKREQARWESLVARTRDTVIKIVEEGTGVRNLRSKLLNEQVNTPLAWTVLPVYIHELLNYKSSQVAVMFLSNTLPPMILSPVAGCQIDRVGPFWTAVI
ncbi:hypothetical protein N8T08_001984 [Aspergillus melleus]|uniref:Uncharacterized protein n=1 Tax=Aspergillus melleus TaxID=138277 RepID=A0ACC3B9E9_9EURO|nr:hypothetical protein N8T08_001984 [Aspergillus melleus]